MKPIPLQMLRQTVRLVVPTEVGIHQSVEAQTDYTVRRVCLQRASSTARTKDNTTLTTTATLFVDARLTQPRLDWWKLKEQAEAAGAQMLVQHEGRDYTVVNVKPIMDDHASLHHYEVELV